MSLSRSARRRGRLLAGLTVLIVSLSASASALAAPTVNLVPSCHDPNYAYGFYGWLSGFPPNLPFTAVVTTQAGSSSFSYVTDEHGNTFHLLTTNPTAMGLVTATVTATIDGTQRSFTATLANPCENVTLGQAMCGDRGYLTWDFGSFTACDIYANGLSHGEATPTLKLRPICQPGLSGFTAGALGFPPGTAVTGTLTDDSGTISANYVANRFGTLGSGPTSFVLGSQSQITVSLSSNLGTITKTLTSASCPT